MDTSEYHEVSVTFNSNYTVIFTIPKRYTSLVPLNRGAQGDVAKALDVVTKKEVAIKKLINPFARIDTAVLVYREIGLLLSIKHPNIINTLDIFTTENTAEEMNDVYIVMEFLPKILKEVVDYHTEHKMLSFLLYQMLCGVNHMHRNSIMHRDLKPENMEVGFDCCLKFLDFGLARDLRASNGLSGNAVTRWYRAPEVVLGIGYDEKVDVWSIGCIFAELITKEVLFPGTSREEQYYIITKVLGTPDPSFLANLRPAAANLARQVGFSPTPSMEMLFPDELFKAESEIEKSQSMTAEAARDILSKMLTIDPDNRSSVIELLQHPYVRNWCREDEIYAPTNPLSIDLENDPTTIPDAKARVFEKINHRP